MKKVISLLLVIVLIAGLFSISVSASTTTEKLTFGKIYSVESKQGDGKFVFSIPETGYFDFEYSLTQNTQVSGGPGIAIGLNYHSFSYSITSTADESKTLYSYSVTDNPIYVTVGGEKKAPPYLLGGSYYLNVSVQNYDVSFSAEFISSEEDFIETYSFNNNTPANADTFPLNESVQGTLAIDDDCDYYKFTLKRKSEVTVWLDDECGYVQRGVSSAPSSATYHELAFGLYDANQTLISPTDSESFKDEDIGVFGTTITNQTREIDYLLNPGTYYVKISDWAYYGLKPDYTLYMFNHCIEHSYKQSVQKATLTRNGLITYTCSECGDESTTAIYYPKTIALSAANFTYTGKAVTPKVTVKGSNGKVIAASNYTVTYASGRKTVGKYAVKVTFKGNYSGSKMLYFNILPKGTKIAKLSAGKKCFAVKWKKQAVQTTGYQVQYATNAKFTGAKTLTVKSNAKTAYTIKNLAAKRVYYARIRTYKVVGGKVYASPWSVAAKVKTK